MTRIGTTVIVTRTRVLPGCRVAPVLFAADGGDPDVGVEEEFQWGGAAHSRPSMQARMWVFELDQGKPLFEEIIARGRNSGGDLARVSRIHRQPDVEHRRIRDG